MKSFRGIVDDAGGGEVRIVVDRDTEEYPQIGQKVRVAQDDVYGLSAEKIEELYQQALQSMRDYIDEELGGK